MEKIVIKLTRQVKRHFRRTIIKIKDARLKTRYHTSQDLRAEASGMSAWDYLY